MRKTTVKKSPSSTVSKSHKHTTGPARDIDYTEDIGLEENFEYYEEEALEEDSEYYEEEALEEEENDFQFIDLDADEPEQFKIQEKATPGSRSKIKEKKSKDSPTPVSKGFRIFLLIYLSLLFFITLGALGFLWKSLADYQENYDVTRQQAALQVSINRAPQICFDEYLETMTEDDWVALWYDHHPEHFDSEEDVRTFLQENLIQVPYTCWKAPSYTKENPVYLIKTQEQPLAFFSLEGEELSWQVTSVQLNLSGKESGSVVVPEDCDVFCNGILLQEQYQTTVSDSVADYAYADSVVHPVSYMTCQVEGLLSAPNLTISLNSDSRHVARDTAGTYYIALNDGAEYQDKAEDFIRALLHYYSYGKNSISENMAAAISHVDSSSHAATIIRQSFDGVHWCNFDNANYVTSASDVYVLADNAYCVDISYENTNAPEAEDGTREINIYRVYFFDFGNGFKIYNFSMI